MQAPQIHTHVQSMFRLYASLSFTDLACAKLPGMPERIAAIESLSIACTNEYLATPAGPAAAAQLISQVDRIFISSEISVVYIRLSITLAIPHHVHSDMTVHVHIYL